MCLRWHWELDGHPAPVTQAGMTCGSRYLSLTCILMCDFYEHCATYSSAAVCNETCLPWLFCALAAEVSSAFYPRQRVKERSEAHLLVEENSSNYGQNRCVFD